MEKRFHLNIFRGETGAQHWESFEIPLTPSLNVISALMEVQKRPINSSGEKVTPVVWEQGCLEEVCGSCSMLIQGKPRQACTALIEPMLQAFKTDTIHLAPLTKFPLLRDLVVDRQSMFEDLKKVRAWISAESSYGNGFGPKISQKKQEVMYTLSTCMTCGCCSEACPQVSAKSKFVGPAPISQARLFNINPIGFMEKGKRLRPLMKEGGISDCGNAQNCVHVCPKEIPLTESIAAMGGDVAKEAFKAFFRRPDQDQ